MKIEFDRDKLVAELKRNTEESVRVNFILGKKLYERFRARCEKEDVPMSRIVGEFIKLFLGEK